MATEHGFFEPDQAPPPSDLPEQDRQLVHFDPDGQLTVWKDGDYERIIAADPSLVKDIPLTGTWKALEVGNEIMIDGRTATVTGINLDNGTVELASLFPPDATITVGVDTAAPDSDKTGVQIGGFTPLGDFDFELDSFTEVQGHSEQLGGDFLARFFEPEPIERRVMYRKGDTVKTKRVDHFGWIPLGAEGVLVEIEHPESVMASKGRDFRIEFDLTQYRIPVDPNIIALVKQNYPDEPVPEFKGKCTTNLGFNDFELVKKGENWNNPHFVYPHEFDQSTYIHWQERLAEQSWQALEVVTAMMNKGETTNGTE